jgi:hypothetical protein
MVAEVEQAREIAGDPVIRVVPAQLRRQGGPLLRDRAVAWVAAEVGRIYGVVDDLPAHRVTDVLLFGLAYPRWEFEFQPKYAAYT